MIRDDIEHNETVKPNSHELDLLRSTLPHYFDKDGNFLLERLTSALAAEEVDLSKESFGLNFLGRSYANYLDGLRSETVLIPDLEHNADTENAASKNLYLVGDNLDVLKHLTSSYSNSVKCIYIDPPYNTGTDGFTYRDDFGFTVESLVEKVGLGKEEAERTLALQGKASHSAWLTFMLPRLLTAQRLLKEDGAIFISIGEDEYANLKLLCDPVFGEQNFVADLIWQSRRSISDDREFSQNHTHTLVYSKNREKLTVWGDELDENEYTNPDNDPRGPWKLSPLDANKPGGDTMYSVKNPTTGEEHWPSQGRYWAINSQDMADLVKDGRVAFGKRGATRPQRKLFYHERVAKGDTKTPSTLLLDVGTTADGTVEVEVFSVPTFSLIPSPLDSSRSWSSTALLERKTLSF